MDWCDACAWNIASASDVSNGIDDDDDDDDDRPSVSKAHSIGTLAALLDQ